MPIRIASWEPVMHFKGTALSAGPGRSPGALWRYTLLEGGTLEELLAVHRKNEAAATVLTAVLQDPAGYGRVIRSTAGRVEEIVEELHATESKSCAGN